MLELKNVSKRYDGFELNISMSVKPGYITGLVGQNGAGKSTAFKTILGLTEYDSGSISLLGKTPQELTPRDKENIGVVLADTGFGAYLTLKDISLILKNLYKSFDSQEFLKKCSKFSLPEDKRLKDFSTGMKAKAKLIIALSHSSKLLILDEPANGLDCLARGVLTDMLRAYMEEHEDCSILISSHISSDLEGLCDDIYMIDNGRIILHEDTDVLLSEYGIIKVTEKQYEDLDMQYILYRMKESFGYSCLTNQKKFYLENYKGITIENSSIDSIISTIIRGEKS